MEKLTIKKTKRTTFSIVKKVELIAEKIYFEHVYSDATLSNVIKVFIERNYNFDLYSIGIYEFESLDKFVHIADVEKDAIFEEMIKQLKEQTKKQDEKSQGKKIENVNFDYINEENFIHIDVYYEGIEEGETAAIVCKDTNKVFFINNQLRRQPLIFQAIRQAKQKNKQEFNDIMHEKEHTQKQLEKLTIETIQESLLILRFDNCGLTSENLDSTKNMLESMQYFSGCTINHALVND